MRSYSEDQGKETRPTHRHNARGTLFHLDYVFVPSTWAREVCVRVWTAEVWGRWSDHFPVVVDIMTAPAPRTRGA